MLNLDTHVFLFAISGELTAKERRLLSSTPWSVSAIVLWEIAKPASLGRIDVDLDTPAVAAALQTTIWPLTAAICGASVRLDVRSDPADEIIGATSVVQRKVQAKHFSRDGGTARQVRRGRSDCRAR